MHTYYIGAAAQALSSKSSSTAPASAEPVTARKGQNHLHFTDVETGCFGSGRVGSGRVGGEVGSGRAVPCCVVPRVSRRVTGTRTYCNFATQVRT